MNVNIKNKITFAILLLLMHFRVNLIGSMSLTEIYVLTQIPRLLRWVNTKGKQIPYLNKIVNGFYLLIVVQCISEFMIQNTLVNAMKGIAVTVMALFLMLFFLEKILKDLSLLKLIPLISIVSLMVFGDQFGFAERDAPTRFKFYTAPIIIYTVCFLSMLPYKIIQKNLKLILCIASIFIIIGGARSLGFSLFFTIVFYTIFSRYKTIKLRKILPGIIIGVIAIQSFLTFIYMPKVKSGEWGSEQNRAQFELIDWNSSIFAIIFAARTDFFVSAIAFKDKPLWGHGSWAMDTTGKYFYLQEKLLDKDDIKDPGEFSFVPNHSVVMGKGTANGIFAFLIFLWIFITIYKVGFVALKYKSNYSIYLMWTFISSFQLMMFGPPAVLKNNGSLAFAIMFSLFCYSMYNNKLDNNGRESKIIRGNSNI